MFNLATIAIATVGVWLASPAMADDAASDWNSTPGYKTSDQQAVEFNRAQQQLLAKKGLLGNRIYDYRTTTTNCEVSAACTTNDSTNLNGVTVVTVNGGSGDVVVDTNTSSDNTDQNNNHTAATDISKVIFK